MKVYTTDGTPIKWNLTGLTLGHVPEKLCSVPHIKARELLPKVFPTDLILEEVPLPNSQLKLDFFLPNRKLAVEVDGKQHDQRVGFFHKTPRDFYHAQANDRKKDVWCELNHIKIVRLKYDEENLWQSQLAEDK